MKYFFKWDFNMYRKSYGTFVAAKNEKKDHCAWRSAQLESEEFPTPTVSLVQPDSVYTKPRFRDVLYFGPIAGKILVPRSK